jgi:hypothetical protein
MDYDAHYELPGGGTVSVDYGAMEGRAKETAKNVIRGTVRTLRER